LSRTGCGAWRTCGCAARAIWQRASACWRWRVCLRLTMLGAVVAGGGGIPGVERAVTAAVCR